MRRARPLIACVAILFVVACISPIDANSNDTTSKTVRAFALDGVANSTLLPLPKYVSAVRFPALEMQLMSSGHHFIIGVFPKQTTGYCASHGVKEVWRRFARSIEGVASSVDALDVVESEMEGTDVSRIAETFSKVSRTRSRKFACGFMAYSHYNTMEAYEGRTTDSNALAEFFTEKLRHAIGPIEEVRNRHEAMEFVERNESSVRVILLEKPSWADLYARAMYGNVAYARASSLIGFKYLFGLMFNEPGIAGIIFIPNMDALEDPDKLKRAEVKFIVRDPEAVLEYFAAADVVLDAVRALGYEALVESTIDFECANAVWQLASNSVHPEYAAENDEDAGDGDEAITPPRAWEFLKSDLLAVLDGHGKGDKVLMPEQWMCGLAGLTAAHREMANEYAEVADAISTLEMLQKENLGLRQRNAELEREVARCDVRGGPKAPSGTKRLPKTKPNDWTFEKSKRAKPVSTVVEDREEEEEEDKDTASVDDEISAPYPRDEL